MGAVSAIRHRLSRPLHFIVARGRVQAELTAEIDWKWERCRENGRAGWRNKKGQFVQYVSHVEQLCGFDRGTIIYLGYKWYENKDLRHLRQIADARGYILANGED